MNPIVLCNKEEISGLCHISDICIWNNRHEEYENVFKTLCKSLKKHGDILIVITGKLEMTRSDSVSQLVEDLLTSLSKIGSVIVVNQQHLLPNIPNVHHITDRGVYEYRNIALAYRARIKNEYEHTFGLDTTGNYDYVLASGTRAKVDNLIAPGSLIQQSCETEYGSHGYQYYDLRSDTTTFVKLRNSYGYCQLCIKNGTLINTVIPEKATIRYVLDNSTYEQYATISKEIASTHEVIASTVTTKLDTSIDFDPKAMLVSYLKNLPNGSELLELHRHISSKVSSNTKANVSGQWRILKLEFDNTMAYGKGNCIDFTKYSNNSVIGIVAPNRYGKTAIADIILYCLFEKLSRGNKNEIINSARDSFSCALTFEANGSTYCVKRTGSTATGVLKTKVNLSKNGINISGSSKTETNKRIESIVGNWHDYIATYFHMSNDKGQFIDMSSAQKKEYMFDLLNITGIQRCHETAKAKLKKYQALLKSMVLPPNLLTDRKRKILEIDVEIRRLKNIPDLEIFVSDLPERKQYPDLRSYNVTPNNIREIISNTKSKITDVSLQRKQCYDDLQAKQRKLAKIRAKIKPLRDEYDSLMSQLVHIPNDYDAEQLEYLKGYDLNTKAIEKEIELCKLTPVKLNDISNTVRRLRTLDDQLMDSLHNLDQITQEQAIVLSKEIKWLRSLADKLVNDAKSFCEEHIAELSRQINASKTHINRSVVSREISRLRHIVISHHIDKMTDYDNKIIAAKLSTLRANLETAKRRDYLLSYEPKVANNERIKARLAVIKPLLFGTDELENEIISLTKQLARLDKEMVRSNTLQSHVKQLESYELHLVHYEIKRYWHDRWSSIKRKRESVINKRDADVTRLLSQRSVYEKEIESHIKAKDEHTKLSAKVNAYQCYVNATHPNGVQYEIIKKYLPMIQNQVNSLLEHLTDFTVAFNYDKSELGMSLITRHRVNVQMASGYEKFIVTAALMIVLGRIANQCKPNFIIIDEGWSKVDADNRCKLENTMSLIKSQCNHLILLSHDNNMIATPDHSICIYRKNEMSYIQSSEPLV